jgi:hypothetical protein
LFFPTNRSTSLVFRLSKKQYLHPQAMELSGVCYCGEHPIEMLVLVKQLSTDFLLGHFVEHIEEVYN